LLDTNPSFSNATERSSGYEVAGLAPPPPPPSPYTSQAGPSHPMNSPAPGYPTPPVSSGYTTPHMEHSIGVRPGHWDEEVAISQRPKRTTGRLVINSTLYLYGVLCGAFGASGLLLQGSASTLIGIVFLAYGFIGGILLIPILLVHKRLILRTRIRVVSIVVATVAAGLMSLICAGILAGLRDGLVLSHFLGGIFIIYGIVASIIAVL
jgi:hypothetical protein